MSEGGRRIVQLRPRAGDGEQVANQLESCGYKRVPGNRLSAPPGQQNRQPPTSPQHLSAPPQLNLSRAISDFRSSNDIVAKQYALKFIANQSLNPSTHSELFTSGVIYLLVDAIDSDSPVICTLACTALSNLATSGEKI